ncbi:regulator of microtubule dynamics protein 1-like isoform X2 [Mercenaria mercenaria]|uniref:regulator of microtubule dynamics protein 1-like isoform X2 n=1 Tax=Mercenaria mercenaria TaxID=6596 RepID=UPI00234EED43|nr:regulator of microtubule dynamics protein 1-like isoform X2 [Mercenaria mercenaria]
MATNRLSFVLRTQLRLSCLRNRWQQLRKETNNLNGRGSCYRKLLVPFMTGNAFYAFTIPGFSWGKKEDTEKPKEGKGVLDKTQQILVEADRLYSENEALALYDYLIEFKDMENDEILWRLARAAVDKGKLSKNETEKKALYYEAYGYITRALDLNQANFAVHKWYAILLDYTGELEGNKQRITNSIKVKEHFMKAVELNPKDATSIHSLGQWCFTFADMSWYQRKIAAVIYKSPPSSTYEEALKYFLQAEETEPNFYSMNLLMLGKTYMKLRDAEMAVTYLVRCKDYPVKTPDDQKAHDEAIHLLKVLGVHNKPGLEKLVK